LNCPQRKNEITPEKRNSFRRERMPDNSIVVEQVTEQIQRVNARMTKIKQKVAVMSGKSGVG
jgi:Mrp family chromosome partitioning ATPase